MTAGPTKPWRSDAKTNRRGRNAGKNGDTDVNRRIIIAVAAVAAAAAGYAYFTGRQAEPVSYRFVTLERGDLEAVVSATGRLSAVTTVQVGTQISGLISALYVDFNDPVEKGQLIAQLDTTLLESNLRDAEASLDRQRADLRQAQRDFERIATLHAQGISPDADFNKVQHNLDVAAAGVKSAEASLARARQNLAYATITAPVSGIVVERDVDVGQTVAASLAAPKLFLIANDLSQMQILASVDESDIGQIQEGQDARFTVKAYGERTFSGRVRQVRLQSNIEQNVVNYTVVIDVENPDSLLLPGMTATVEFLVSTAADVLKVPNAALRFRPTDSMLAELRERRQRERAQRGQGDGESGRPEPGSGRGFGGGGFPGGAPGGSGGMGQGRTPTLLWFLDADGRLDARPVRAGITDGQFTEVQGRDLKAGLEVIAGVTQARQVSGTTNPFQLQQQQPRRGPMGPGF